MSDIETQEISGNDVAPIGAVVTGLGFTKDGSAAHASLDPNYVNTHALGLIATHLPPIQWEFDDEAKAYYGATPYGSYELKRNDNGRLYAVFTSACETHTSHVNLHDGISIAEAKVAIVPALLDSLNQNRRLDLVIPKTDDVGPALSDEPDLI